MNTSIPMKHWFIDELYARNIFYVFHLKVILDVTKIIIVLFKKKVIFKYLLCNLLLSECREWVSR